MDPADAITEVLPGRARGAPPDVTCPCCGVLAWTWRADEQGGDYTLASECPKCGWMRLLKVLQGGKS